MGKFGTKLKNLPIKTGKINDTNHRSLIQTEGRTFELSGEISKDAIFLTLWD